MSDEHERAFLQSVIDTPDDDAPRLIFADWLEDNGDPQRAQFIRLQCRIAQIWADDPQRLRLRAEERPLLQEMMQRLHDKKRARQPGALQAWTRGQGIEFDRGFVGRMRTTATRFLHGADALMKAAPIQHLALSNVGPKVDRLVACPYLARLRSLNLESNKLRDEIISKLFACPHLAGLKRLDLGQNRFRIEGTGALANSPHLAGLERLSLINNRIHDRGPEALAESPHLTNLKWLDLADCQIGARGAAALGRSTALRQLEHLDLSRNRILDRGARDLAEGGALQNLTCLEMGMTPLSAEGVQALLTSSGMPKLTKLTVLVEGNPAPIWRITPARHLHGRLHFAPVFIEHQRLDEHSDSPLLAACAGLHLTRDAITTQTIETLSRTAVNLQALTLEWNDLSAKALGELARANWPHLRRLTLINNRFANAGAEELARSPLIRQLTHLEISYSGMGQKGAEKLAAADGWANLVELRLRDWGHQQVQTLYVLRERFGWRVTSE